VPNEDPTIRRGQLKDAVTIAAFNIRMAMETEKKRLDPYGVSSGVKAVLLDETKGFYFVADLDGRVIGQLMVTFEWSDWRNGNIWWVQSVYVHPDFRKQGIFRSLLDAVLAAAQQAEAVMVRLYVETDNAVAQSTYAKLGMQLTTYGVMEMPVARQ
jgi:ribosomal protein S18 acetylase RimI-like enzyme